jgi:hypothetical protein
MATRYEDVIANWENNSSNSDVALDGTTFPVYEEWLLNILLDWHQNDPVSQKEIDRNNAIYDIQNNRNPFVDHSEYVAMVWGGAQIPAISNVNHQPNSPAEFEAVTVSATITDDGTIETAILHYGMSSSNLNNDVNMSASGSNYSAQIPGQAAGQMVYYRISASDDEDNTTQSPIYNYQVAQNPGFIALPFLEDFNDQTLGVFVEFSVAGPEQIWHNDDYNSDYYAKMSNYNGSENIENDDWMITPAINFNAYENEVLRFRSSMKDYDDNSVHINLYYSTNYSGSGDPSGFTWHSLSDQAYWSPGDYEWVESGDIDLSGIDGNKVYIAFRYDSQAGSGKTWQIDDIGITADPNSVNSYEVDQSFRVYPNPAQDYIYISSTKYQVMDISIIHSSGKVVLQQNNIHEMSKLDISNLAAGYYLLRIENGKNISIISLIIF